MNDQPLPFHLCFQQVGDANLWFLSFNRIPIAWMRLKASRWLAEKILSILGLSCVSVTNGPFIDGRTTGIEPARGGFTIHCLDPLGYIRPYPRTGFSLYLRSDPFWTPYDRYQREAFSYTIVALQVYCCVLELGEEKLQTKRLTT